MSELIVVQFSVVDLILCSSFVLGRFLDHFNESADIMLSQYHLKCLIKGRVVCLDKHAVEVEQIVLLYFALFKLENEVARNFKGTFAYHGHFLHFWTVE